MEPISTIGLFPVLDKKLIELLRSLDKADWEKQTIAPLWKVKDIAAHLLDGNIRSLSMLRDAYFGERAEHINSYRDLVDFLNGLNATWVKAMQRVSPAVLIDLLESTGKEYFDFLKTLPPHETATFPVAWAGETESENWFHIAREYTEKWHHQQQIRLAVGKTQELYSHELYYPYLDTSMRALPHHYREVSAGSGEVIRFTITGRGGGNWYLYHENDGWDLLEEFGLWPVCEVQIDGEIAWRIFTKGISRQEAARHLTITGKTELGERVLDMLAVMA